MLAEGGRSAVGGEEEGRKIHDRDMGMCRWGHGLVCLLGKRVCATGRARKGVLFRLGEGSSVCEWGIRDCFIDELSWRWFFVPCRSRMAGSWF